jgi:alpha-soluble NSF attachment protein
MADQLVIEATKKSNTFFFTDSNRDKAIELFTKAGNLYMVDKDYEKSAQAFLKAAELNEKIKENYNAVEAYLAAAKAYKFCDLDKAIDLYKIIINLQKEENNMTGIGKSYVNQGDLYLQQVKYEPAITSYLEAIKYYEANDQDFKSVDLRKKICTCAIKNKNYALVKEHYKILLELALQKEQTYGFTAYAYTYLLAMVGCDDSIEKMQETLENLAKQSSLFGTSKEYQLFNYCLTNDDEEQFSDYVSKYDNLHKLDNFSGEMLLKLKRKVFQGLDDDFTGAIKENEQDFT